LFLVFQLSVQHEMRFLEFCRQAHGTSAQGMSISLATFKVVAGSGACVVCSDSGIASHAAAATKQFARPALQDVALDQFALSAKCRLQLL